MGAYDGTRMAASLLADRTADRIEALKRSASLKPHGTRGRYVGDKCRCALCRRANTIYRLNRDRELKSEKLNVLVSSDAARNHMEQLSAIGIGYKTVCDAAGISKSVASRILWGTRRQIRTSTSDAILAVDKTCPPDAALIPAAPTWKIIDGPP